MPVFDFGDGPHYPFRLRIHEGLPVASVGILFNYQYVFHEPGTYRLSILENETIPTDFPSTFYREFSTGPDHFWSDISNNHAYNTIVVEL